MTMNASELISRRLALALAATLTGCSAVKVYDSQPSARCMMIGPVKYSLLVPAGSTEQATPLNELRARVLEACKEEARDAGANALFVTDRSESDSIGGKALTINCSGMAYACP